MSENDKKKSKVFEKNSVKMGFLLHVCKGGKIKNTDEEADFL